MSHQLDAHLPLVSVVTPSYNKGRFIEETILSVKNQTYPRIEHIVVDGGSTDGTLDILKKYGDSLIWISEPDKGQSDAINKGWRMSKGDILAYLNADDTYTPLAVETAVKFFTEHPDAGMMYGECNIIDERGEVAGRVETKDFDLSEILCGPNTVPQPSVFLRRAVLDEVGYIDTGLHMAMDLDLWIRIGLRFRVEHVPEVLANYRRYSETKTVGETHRFWPEYFAILDKTFRSGGLPSEVRALKGRAFSFPHMMLFHHYRSEGDRPRALYHLSRTLCLHPQRLRELGGWKFLVGFFIEFFFGKRALAAASQFKRRLQATWSRR